MFAVRRLLAGPALAVLAVIGLLSVTAPATASGDLACVGAQRFHCSLDNAASGEAWTVNGTAYPSDNGKSSADFTCQLNHEYYISVSYINTAGSPETASANAYCASNT